MNDPARCTACASLAAPCGQCFARLAHADGAVIRAQILDPADAAELSCALERLAAEGRVLVLPPAALVKVVTTTTTEGDHSR